MEIVFDIARELGQGDLARVGSMRATSAVSSISRLHAKHHALARYLALDYSMSDAAHIAGYSVSAAGALAGDPTFESLVDFYRGEHADKALELSLKINGLAKEAVDLLTEKLTEDDQRAKITVGQALEIAKLSLDRSGYAPQTKTEVNVNVNIADRLDAARKRMKTIDVVPTKE